MFKREEGQRVVKRVEGQPVLKRVEGMISEMRWRGRRREKRLKGRELIGQSASGPDYMKMSGMPWSMAPTGISTWA